MRKWEKTVTRSDVTRWFAGFLLVTACLQTIAAIVGELQGRDVGLNGLWVLALTAAAVALRTSARLDDLRAELHAQAAHAEAVTKAAHERLDAQGNAISGIISEVGALRFRKSGQ